MSRRIEVEPVVPIVVRMPADLHRAVKAKAAAEERSMAQMIRYALRLYTETKDKTNG